MHLFNVHSGKFWQTYDNIPPYVAALHWWKADTETSYQDVEERRNIHTDGSRKLQGFAEYIKKHIPHVEWLWIDTCCINQKDAAELSEGVNSIGCEDEDELGRSGWFARGWTLQELIASKCVILLTNTWQIIGHKDADNMDESMRTMPVGKSLTAAIARRTGVPEVGLQDRTNSDASVKKTGWPDAEPKPSYNVPFRRDPHFVERPFLTDQVRAKLSIPKSRVELAGLGGVGKSQLAIDYAHELRQQSPNTWVLWIHASNAAQFEQSVRDAVDVLKLHGREEPKVDLLLLLRNWLRDEGKGKWLIVLDNADDAGFLLEQLKRGDEVKPAQRRMDYIPVCDHGSVLITTRSRNQALRLVFENDTVNVLPMSVDEAVSLLETKLGETGEDCRELALALDCTSLAITQAVAYIRERTPRCSVRQYHMDMEQSRASRMGLLRREVSLPDQDAEATNSVLLTWQISFEHLYTTRRSAAELLSLMSCCDRLAIPEILLRVSDADEREDFERASSFEDDIVALRSFSFVSQTVDAQTWEMHRLVQDATQLWPESQSRLDDVRNRFVHCLYMSFPNGDFENWPMCRTLFPHAKVAMGQQPHDVGTMLEGATVMYRSAWYALELGAMVDGLAMAKAAVRVRSRQLGEEDEQTLSIRALIGWQYRDQGRWNKAEELNVKVVDTRIRALGSEHSNTLASINNLALIYWSEGHLGQAEELGVKVVEARIRVLGSEHPDTLASMDTLVNTYLSQGLYGEAEELGVKVMETMIRVLGSEHPDTLTSMDTLANTYWSQGRYREAEELHVKVVEASIRVLGNEHPDTLGSMFNLAIIYHGQGRWQEA
ncbi:hypothetical protein LTR62_000513 [Meristemomyces frigidus]|uniref:DUF7779 domain-containing protein n=1 Tax=Meristemomyces frigidus TaxID=1508187 RepID=A0AAN7TA65_9PEZI|nr:hypothetical protein LTR62_000513 [Meristemomyces frigidus]